METRTDIKLKLKNQVRKYTQKMNDDELLEWANDLLSRNEYGLASEAVRQIKTRV
jgi:hypothetical protein